MGVAYRQEAGLEAWFPEDTPRLRGPRGLVGSGGTPAGSEAQRPRVSGVGWLYRGTTDPDRKGAVAMYIYVYI